MFWLNSPPKTGENNHSPLDTGTERGMPENPSGFSRISLSKSLFDKLSKYFRTFSKF